MLSADVDGSCLGGQRHVSVKFGVSARSGCFVKSAVTYLIDSLHFARVVDDAKCIVVNRVCVCLSLCHCMCVCVSVCLSVCPRPYAHTTARTRM